MLVIAYNQALMIRDEEKEVIEGHPENEKTQAEHWKDIYSEPTGFQALIEDEERMDIIGQNGNDGLHYDSEPNEPLEENDPLRPTLKGGIKSK